MLAPVYRIQRLSHAMLLFLVLMSLHTFNRYLVLLCFLVPLVRFELTFKRAVDLQKCQTTTSSFSYTSP